MAFDADNIDDSQLASLDTESGEGTFIGTTGFADVWCFVGGFGEHLGVTAEGDICAASFPPYSGSTAM
jgi:hypothetical protein